MFSIINNFIDKINTCNKRKTFTITKNTPFSVIMFCYVSEVNKYGKSKETTKIQKEKINLRLQLKISIFLFILCVRLSS